MKQLTKDKAEKLKAGAVVFVKAIPQKTPGLVELGPDVGCIYVPCRVTGLTSKKWVRAVVDLRDRAYYDLDLHQLGVLGVEQVFAPSQGGVGKADSTLPVYYFVRGTAGSTIPMLADTAEEMDAAIQEWIAFLTAKDAALQEREAQIEAWAAEQDRAQAARYAEAVAANKHAVEHQVLYASYGQFMHWWIDVRGRRVEVWTALEPAGSKWRVTELVYYWQGFKPLKVSSAHSPSKTWQQAVSGALYQLAYRLWDVLEAEPRQKE